MYLKTNLIKYLINIVEIITKIKILNTVTIFPRRILQVSKKLFLFNGKTLWLVLLITHSPDLQDYKTIVFPLLKELCPTKKKKEN